jgi:hypothetical protein
MHEFTFGQYVARHHVLGVQANDIIADEKDPTARMRNVSSGSIGGIQRDRNKVRSLANF